MTFSKKIKSFLKFLGFLDEKVYGTLMTIK